MRAISFFISSCPKCGRSEPQRGFSRAALLRLLSAAHPIEGYCATCDEFWAIGPREGAALAGRLNGRGVDEFSPLQEGERP